VSTNDIDEASGPIIQLSRVRKSYGDNDALRDVSFGIMRGELAFLVGPSGAGKSTVLKLLTRELIADEGRVVVAGRELSSMGVRHIPQLRRAIAYVPQDYPLLPGRNLEENVKFALSVLGWPRARAGERCDEVLELVGLSDKRGSNAEELSGGERQRAAIARAVACAPNSFS
jgi:cell division transport system ATP-binding protein